MSFDSVHHALLVLFINVPLIEILTIIFEIAFDFIRDRSGRRIV